VFTVKKRWLSLSLSAPREDLEALQGSSRFCPATASCHRFFYRTDTTAGQEQEPSSFSGLSDSRNAE